jgi:hypothetical protein
MRVVLIHAIHPRRSIPDAIRDQIFLDREVRKSKFVSKLSFRDEDETGTPREDISRIRISFVRIEFRSAEECDGQRFDHFVECDWT